MSEFYSEPGEDAEEKRIAVGKILADPTLYPEEFRSWLTRFIEGSGIKIPWTSIQGKPPPGDGSITIDGVPPGTLLAFAGANPVLGQAALVCNGQAVSREEFAILFSVIGTTYGQGDGSTTFNVPDIQDRTLFMRGSNVTMGGNEGQPLGTRGPRHHHGFSGGTSGGGSHSHSGSTSGVGDHTHFPPSFAFILGDGTTYTVNSSSGSQRFLAQDVQGTTAGAGSHSHTLAIDSAGDHSHSFSGNTSGGGALDAPGYLGVLYVIVTGL